MIVYYLVLGVVFDVFKEGGIVVDVVICVVVIMSVVLLYMIGIGGDVFWLIYDSECK